MIDAIPLADFGLCTVEEAAERLHSNVRSVQRWIARGLIPAVIVRGGERPWYLLRLVDVGRFQPPPVGYPKGRPRSGD